MMNISDKLARAALDVIIAYCGQFDSECEGCMFYVEERGGCILQECVPPERLETYGLNGKEEE